MKRIDLSVLFSLLSLIVFPFQFFGQCSSCPTAAISSATNGITNNMNINLGQTFIYNGTGNNFNLNFSGGTLIVASDLNLANVNFTGPSSIHILPNVTLTLNSGINLGANASIFNEGALIANSDLILSGTGSILSNCTSSTTMNVSSNIFVNNANAQFVNNGFVNANTLFMQSSGSGQACFGPYSSINLVNLVNNNPNSIQVPSGTACLSYTSNALLNSPLTNTSSLILCQAPGATTSGSSNFGSATVNSNCFGCGITLPIELVYFEANIIEHFVELNWGTQSEINNDYFTVERTRDLRNFEVLGTIPGAINSQGEHSYNLNDYNPLMGTSYYRLKQTNLDGSEYYSDIKTVNISSSVESQLSVYPNPSSSFISISSDPNKLGGVEVFNLIGESVTYMIQFDKSSNKRVTLDIQNLASGTYLLQTKTQATRFVKM